MSCYSVDRRIVVGTTKKKALITVCTHCSAYGIPHLNYISKKYEVTLSLLSARFVDSFENIELDDRTDLEEFLNTIVTKDDIEKTTKLIEKLNKQFFRKQEKHDRKYKDLFAKLNRDEGEKFFKVDVEELEENMSYWQLIVKLWNKHNEEQTPKNLLKPYYRNFIEYIDTATFATTKDLNGAKAYTKMDQERTPHFICRTVTGEEIAILFEKAEYLQPIPRKLTQDELNKLVNFLIDCKESEYTRKVELKSNWQRGAWLWNNQNYDSNDWNPTWFPKYLKVDENMKMPDYSKLNDEKIFIL